MPYILPYCYNSSVAFGPGGKKEFIRKAVNSSETAFQILFDPRRRSRCRLNKGITRKVTPLLRFLGGRWPSSIDIRLPGEFLCQCLPRLWRLMMTMLSLAVLPSICQWDECTLWLCTMHILDHSSLLYWNCRFDFFVCFLKKSGVPSDDPIDK